MLFRSDVPKSNFSARNVLEGKSVVLSARSFSAVLSASKDFNVLPNNNPGKEGCEDSGGDNPRQFKAIAGVNQCRNVGDVSNPCKLKIGGG